MNEVPQNINQRVGEYVALRDRLREIEAEFDEKKKPFRAAMDKLEGILMAHMESTGSEAIRTEHGTCHTTSRTTASIADGEAFRHFVIDNAEFDLLDFKANATAVKDFVKTKGSLPPGVNLTTMKKVGVRRA